MQHSLCIFVFFKIYLATFQNFENLWNTLMYWQLMGKCSEKYGHFFYKKNFAYYIKKNKTSFLFYDGHETIEQHIMKQMNTIT
jgi:hypothetical protein